MQSRMLTAVVGAIALIASASEIAVAGPYQETILVTSASDPDLINPWGISFSGASPFWVSDNGTGRATLYNSAGVKQGLVVSMPGGDPITGQVFNGTSSFNSDLFIFASESGTIDGWKGGTTAEQLSTVSGAVYKGLAITTAKDTLFAANFNSGAIDEFTGPGAPVASFSDPTVPAGYAPFNVQNIGGTFYVTFAVQDGAKHDDVPGLGNGLVDIFNPVTHTFTRLVTGNALNAPLDSPWGVALAPGTFDGFGGALLVGNFGDGTINAFNPATGAYLGALEDVSDNPLTNPGLWGLTFGNGGSGGSPNALYFTAGGADEDIGVFGRIAAVPEPTTLALLGIGFAGLGLSRRKR